MRALLGLVEARSDQFTMRDVVKGYAVALVSLLAGASFVHRIYKPDLTLPVEKEDRKQG